MLIWKAHYLRSLLFKKKIMKRKQCVLLTIGSSFSGGFPCFCKDFSVTVFLYTNCGLYLNFDFMNNSFSVSWFSGFTAERTLIFLFLGFSLLVALGTVSKGGSVFCLWRSFWVFVGILVTLSSPEISSKTEAVSNELFFLVMPEKLDRLEGCGDINFLSCNGDLWFGSGDSCNGRRLLGLDGHDSALLVLFFLFLFDLLLFTLVLFPEAGIFWEDVSGSNGTCNLVAETGIFVQFLNLPD